MRWRRTRRRAGAGSERPRRPRRPRRRRGRSRPMKKSHSWRAGRGGIRRRRWRRRRSRRCDRRHAHPRNLWGAARSGGATGEFEDDLAQAGVRHGHRLLPRPFIYSRREDGKKLRIFFVVDGDGNLKAGEAERIYRFISHWRAKLHSETTSKGLQVWPGRLELPAWNLGEPGTHRCHTSAQHVAQPGLPTDVLSTPNQDHSP